MAKLDQTARDLEAQVDALRRQVGELEDRLAAVDSTRDGFAPDTALWQAIQSLDDGLVVFDDQARLVLANRRYREFYEPASRHWSAGTSLARVQSGA